MVVKVFAHLPTPPLSGPNRTPITYSSAGLSGKNGESEDGNGSDMLLINVKNEDYDHLLSLDESDVIGVMVSRASDLCSRVTSVFDDTAPSIAYTERFGVPLQMIREVSIFPLLLL